MTKITEKEPVHWHTTSPDGTIRHNMTDPRTTGLPRIHWDMDDRAYVAHLEEHERRKTSLQPRDNDPDVVATLVAYIRSEENRIAGLHDLVIKIREEIDGGVAPQKSQWLKALTKIWPGVGE